MSWRACGTLAVVHVHGILIIHIVVVVVVVIVVVVIVVVVIVVVVIVVIVVVVIVVIVGVVEAPGEWDLLISCSYTLFFNWKIGRMLRYYFFINLCIYFTFYNYCFLFFFVFSIMFYY